jgi:hypothetical protein
MEGKDAMKRIVLAAVGLMVAGQAFGFASYPRTGGAGSVVYKISGTLLEGEESRQEESENLFADCFDANTVVGKITQSGTTYSCLDDDLFFNLDDADSEKATYGTPDGISANDNTPYVMGLSPESGAWLVEVDTLFTADGRLIGNGFKISFPQVVGGVFQILQSVLKQVHLALLEKVCGTNGARNIILKWLSGPKKVEMCNTGVSSFCSAKFAANACRTYCTEVGALTCTPTEGGSSECAYPAGWDATSDCTAPYSQCSGFTSGSDCAEVCNTTVAEACLRRAE